MQMYIERASVKIHKEAEDKDMHDEEFALAFQSINSIRDWYVTCEMQHLYLIILSIFSI